MSGPSPILAALLVLSAADEAPLGLADLPEYRAALEDDGGRPAAVVAFRDLWDHPEAYRGRLVRVEGRIVRRFHQPAVGTFPALVEAWAQTPRGDLLCLVYPEARGAEGTGSRGPIHFTGTFLRRIRYERQDAAGLAPLIVGGRAPAPARAAEAPAPPGDGTPSRLDWAIGLAVAVFAALILGLQHLRRPDRLRRRPEPPPPFEDDPEPTRHVNGPGCEAR